MTAQILTQHSAPALRIGGMELNSPVILAPMAGVTNMPFRVLCREIEQELTGASSGLYVCEMITARAMVARNQKTLHMTSFAPEETPRSMQLYTVDPKFTYEAVRMIVEEDIADHVDMNFGCPVPKVTRKGGGSAIPYKRRLFGNIVGAAVRAAEGSGIPITVKFRIGIDDEHHTHLDAGRIAAEEGAAAVALHARTAAERYSGTARWDEIARLVDHMDGTGIPVIGNGDVFAAEDAARMMEQTGCHGVEVGRGCLGRPWLFAQLGAQLRGEDIPRSRRWERSRALSTATRNYSRPTTARTMRAAIFASTPAGICAASPSAANSARSLRKYPRSPSCASALHPSQILNSWRKKQTARAAAREAPRKSRCRKDG